MFFFCFNRKVTFFFAGLTFCFIWGLVALLLPSAHTCIYDARWIMFNNNNSSNKTLQAYVKLSPVVIVVTLQCVQRSMYVSECMFQMTFLGNLFFLFSFVFLLSFTVQEPQVSQCELYYSEGLDIPSPFIDFRYAKLIRATRLQAGYIWCRG